MPSTNPATTVLEQIGKSNKGMMTKTILCFLLFSVAFMGQAAILLHSVQELLEETERYSLAAKSRVPKEHCIWTKESARFSDRMFFRLFRMHKPCFNKLCTKIERAVGEDEFRSEKFIEELSNLGNTTKKSSMYNASKSTTGTYLSGEFKLALTLRYLAGASYLDLYLWSNYDPNYLSGVIKYVIQFWICNDDVFSIDFYRDILQNPSRVRKITTDFGASSGGILSGCFGAIDGWLVKVKCPTLVEVRNPGKYMSRKGFFAINVQAIVDKQKRILWRFIGQKGSAHDSKVFKSSELYQHLMLISDDLHEKELYLVGDSAYALRGFIMVPIDNAKPGTQEDAFNYFLSSQRIHVECAFGEIDRRFGIFWKPLEGKLANHQYTIDACMRLHNYIVDYREEMKRLGKGIWTEEYERQELDVESDNFMMENAANTLGAMGDEDVMRQAGRPTATEQFERNRGVELRNKFKEELARNNMARPDNSDFNNNRVDRHNRTVAAQEE